MEPAGEDGAKEVELKEPDTAMVAMISRIVKVAGVQQNFVVKAYTRFNAEAQIIEEGDQPRRYVFYNREFLDGILASGGSEWAEIGIMAHEVAHHLNGHTVENSFSTRELEIAADKSAGFWMGRMGATLAQAQSGFIGFPDVVPPSSPHPRRKERLEAVKAGWDESGGGHPKSERDGVKIMVDEVDANMSNYFLNLRGEYTYKIRDKEYWSYKGKTASILSQQFTCSLTTVDQQKWELSCTLGISKTDGTKAFDELSSHLRSLYPSVKWERFESMPGSPLLSGETKNGQILVNQLDEFLQFVFRPYVFPSRS
jgi:hypothetical protein